MGLQFKQSDNQFSATPTNAKRVGYFSPNRRRCVVIDENTIELRISEYDNHTQFLDEFKLIIDLCSAQGLGGGNKLREVELHYVDLFVPTNHSLKEMFADNVTLPIEQFYSQPNDAIKVGATNFTRILDKGRHKVSINLEQLNISSTERRKYLPDALIEPDQKLSMPLDVDRLFPNSSQNEYAIVHTTCGSLVDMKTIDATQLRETFEMLYTESRKTFDQMINTTICENIWKIESK
jgi:hypothetical protein